MNTSSTKTIIPALLILLGIYAANAMADESAQSVPSYAEALKAMEAQQAQAKGPVLSEQDKAIMQRSTAGLAAEMPHPGLRVGARAPDFELPNAFGKPVRLSEQLKHGPVVLAFYRGAWCPYCNLQLRGLQQSLPRFQQYGARLITITPQTPDKSLGQVKKDGYPFEILSDLDNRVMKAYQLYFEIPPELSDVYIRNFGLDLAEFNGPGRYGLPVPGTYVIDRQGVIRAAFADTNYKKRMEPADIVAALAGLSSQPATANTGH